MIDRAKEDGTRYNVTSCHVFKSTSWSLYSRFLERIKTLHDFFSIFDLPHGVCEHIYIFSYSLKRNSIVSHFSYLIQSILNYCSCKRILLRRDILCEELMNVWHWKNDWNFANIIDSMNFCCSCIIRDYLFERISVLSVFGKTKKLKFDNIS